jgi:phosphatidylethanolamine/phosphatidyl-N-methylethanolamine N-methyltransferase
MIFGLKERLGKKFEQEVQFFRGRQKDKKRVGAVMPTSIHAARRMASVINPGSGRPILELGAGTGAITRAILERGVRPHQLVSVDIRRIFITA